MSLFITLEGPEGSGKTTQLRLAEAYLKERGRRVLVTREPGGTAIGEQIRAVLHDPGNATMLAPAEVLLYEASRAQLVGEVIRPALARGVMVLCDRYAESTLAYQGYGRGLNLAALRQLNEFATGGLSPDLVIYLDLPVEVGLQRKRAAHEREQAEWTRMDQEAIEFHERVRTGYLAMARSEPERWCVVDARSDVDAVQAEIRKRIDALSAEVGDERP
jgi:dTMP kinase